VEAIVRRERIDAILATWAYPDVVASVRLGRQLGVPVVAKVHGSDINVYARGWRRRAVVEALNRCERVLCVSAALREQTAALGVAPDRLVVIPNGVDVTRFAPQDRLFAQFEELPLDAHLLGAFGGQADEAHRRVARLLPQAPLPPCGGGRPQGLAPARLVLAQVCDGTQQLHRLFEGVGALRMAGDLHALPGGQVGVDVPLGLLELLLDGRELGGHVDVVLERLLVQGFELFLEFAQRLLELEQVGGSLHRAARVVAPRAAVNGGCAKVGPYGARCALVFKFPSGL